MAEQLGVSAFPLYWPPAWPRERNPRWSRFGRSPHGRSLTVFGETQSIRRLMTKLGGDAVVISTNLQLRNDGVPYSRQSQPSDAGVAVWFWLKGEERVLACDRWGKVEENMRAIAKHIEALLGQERWGVGSMEQAFRGYQALPERAGGTPWWDVLKVHRDAPPGEIRQAYKKLAREHHPDVGGDRAKWDALSEAYAQALSVVRL